jgi:DinB superfamily
MKRTRIFLLPAILAFAGPRPRSLPPRVPPRSPRPPWPLWWTTKSPHRERQIIDVAEAMPEDKYNFSPDSLNLLGDDYKGVRTFALQVKHVAASNYFIWSTLTGDKLPDNLKDGNGPTDLKTKADILKFLKDSFVQGHKAAATLTVENMLQPVRQGKSPRLHRAEFGVAHAFDHYGQMVEYLRMNGIVPPASRGNSN